MTPSTAETHRNGYRGRRWDTRVGTIELEVPRVRDGGYLPSLLEPRRRAEKAMLTVIQEAYVGGMSTRRVDDLVRALGIEGISKSEVSRICAALNAEVRAFRSRPLGGLRLPLPLARRDLPQGARERAGRVDGGPRHDGCRRQRGAPDPGARAERRQRRGLGLAGVHRGLRRARPARGPPRHQRRPRGSRQGGPRAAPGLGLAAVSRALHPQRPGPGLPRQRPEHGRLGHPGRVRAARRDGRPRPARQGHRHHGRSLHERVAELLTDAETDLLAHSRSPRPTAAGSAAPTRSSASTRKSSAGRRSLASSPTGRACCASSA